MEQSKLEVKPESRIEPVRRYLLYGTPELLPRLDEISGHSKVLKVYISLMVASWKLQQAPKPYNAESMTTNPVIYDKAATLWQEAIHHATIAVKTLKTCHQFFEELLLYHTTVCYGLAYLGKKAPEYVT